MKSLLRRGKTFGIVTTAVLLSFFAGSTSVFALSQEQIKQKLDAVPVYLITNEEGSPLTRSVPAEQNGQKAVTVAGVYMSQQEAEAVITELQSANNQDQRLTDLVKNLQVEVVPLGFIYQQLKQSGNQPEPVVFALQPVKQEVTAAKDLLRQSGEKVEQFPGVPVFVVRFAPDKGYVAIKSNADSKELIPMFLSKQDAQGLLNQVKPEFSTAEIQVIDIDSVIETLEQKNDDWFNQVVIVPSPESRKFLEKLPRQ
ncbi:MAG: hypothetical protein EA343_16785 [Nodularia sp. (in: Bacteria)]|nr:MAG: hypothetical protein EA343_16785 [Nodularia sp. (in: cyanobacteria)]